MSLVNDMLRDLDKRRAGGMALHPKAGELTPAPGNDRKKRKSNFALLLSVLIVVFAGLSYMWVNGRGERSAQLAIDVVPVVPSAAQQLLEEATGRTLEPESRVDSNVTESVNSVVTSTSSNETLVSQAPIVVDEPEREFDTEPTLTANELASVNDAIQAAKGDVQSARENVIQEPVRESAQETIDEPTQAPLLDAVPVEPLIDPPVAVATQATRSINELSPAEKDVAKVQEALALLANNDEAGAFAVLGAHVTEAPLAHQSRETLIKLLISRGESARAERLIDAGLELVANHSGFKKTKARLLIERSEYAFAASVLATRAPDVNTDQEYFELLASAQLAGGDYQGAAQSYRQLIAVDGNQSRWWYGLAVSQDRLGNLTVASQAYRQALVGTGLSASLRRRSEDRVRELSAQ